MLAWSAAQFEVTCSFESTFRVELNKSATIWFQDTEFSKNNNKSLAPLFSPPLILLFTDQGQPVQMCK